MKLEKRKRQASQKVDNYYTFLGKRYKSLRTVKKAVEASLPAQSFACAEEDELEVGDSEQEMAADRIFCGKSACPGSHKFTWLGPMQAYVPSPPKGFVWKAGTVLPGARLA